MGSQTEPVKPTIELIILILYIIQVVKYTCSPIIHTITYVRCTLLIMYMYVQCAVTVFMVYLKLLQVFRWK